MKLEKFFNSSNLKFIFIAIHSILFATLLSLYFITDNRYYFVATITGALSSLIIAVSSIYRKTNIGLAIGFLLLSIADPGVSLTIIGNKDKFLILSPWLYAAFSFLLFLYLYKNNYTELGRKNRLIIYSIRTAVFLLYFSVYSYYVTIPSFIIKHHPFTPEFNLIALIKVSGTFTYSLFVSLALAFAVPQSLVTRNRFNLFFTNSLIIMLVADIVESNSWTFVDQSALERISRIAFAYSIWWSIGLYIIAVCSLYYDNKTLTKERPLNYKNFFSIRSIISITMLLCLPPFLTFFSTVRIVSEYTLYDGIDVAMSVCFIVFLGNIVGDILSYNTSKIVAEYEEKNNDCNLFKKINANVFKLEELETIIDRHNKNVELAKIIQKENIENSQKALMADLTKDFAHEAKRPINLVRAFIDIISKETNPLEVIKSCNKFLNPVKSSVLYVDGYIKDILHYNNSKMQNEFLILEEVITNSLEYISSIHYNKTILVNYNYLHDKKIIINFNSLSRIVENIFNNAIQAVKNNIVEFVIETKNEQIENNNYVYVTIRNYDSSVLDSQIKLIFDENFTKNKKEGSGRGLFLTSKLIQDHSGKIYANSGYDHDNGRDFFEINFSLRASSDIYHKDLSGIKEKYNFSDLNVNLDLYNHINQIDLKLTNKIICYIGLLNRKFSIIVADDDLIVQTYLKDLFQNLGNKILDSIKLTYVSSIEVAINIAKNENFDLAILDVDFKHNNFSGIQLAELIKNKNKNCDVCIHSNLPTDYDFIDLVHPKNIDLQSLVYIIKNTLKKIVRLKNAIFIDDEVEFYDSWKSNNIGYNFIYFKDWEEFNVAIRSKKISTKKIDIIFSDYYFKNGATPFIDVDGSDFDEISNFREMFDYNGKIIILSNDIYGVKVPSGCLISAIMPKNSINIDELTPI